MTTKERVCGRCGGEKHIKGYRCPNCGGTGRLPDKRSGEKRRIRQNSEAAYERISKLDNTDPSKYGRYKFDRRQPQLTPGPQTAKGSAIQIIPPTPASATSNPPITLHNFMGMVASLRQWVTNEGQFEVASDGVSCREHADEEAMTLVNAYKAAITSPATPATPASVEEIGIVAAENLTEGLKDALCKLGESEEKAGVHEQWFLEFATNRITAALTEYAGPIEARARMWEDLAKRQGENAELQATFAEKVGRENTRLRKALGRYGRHDPMEMTLDGEVGCPNSTITGLYKPCTCGFRTALGGD